MNAILILNGRGHVLISRTYRDDVDARSIASAFRSQVIASKIADRCPVKTVGSVSFLFVRHEELFIVAVTRQNANASMVFQFLNKLIDIFKAYFGGRVTEEDLKENFALVYELLDEILDFGYPQNCEPDVLKSLITTKGMQDVKQMNTKQIIDAVTGAVSWRKPNIRYKVANFCDFAKCVNEIFIDVIEQVNMLMSHKGTVLSSDVTGKIMMKSFLSGMPECKFGLNDKLMLQSENTRRRTRGSRFKPIDIDDVTFHQCVKLGKFDSDRTISFIPLDGEFELMRYRITDNIVPPFRLLSPIVREIGKTRIEVQITVKSVFQEKLYGKNVTIKIPVPKNAAKCKTHVLNGKAKHQAEESAIVWVIRRFPGNTEMSLSAEVDLLASTLEAKKWSKPPISLNFQVPMFTASGLHVRFLKVYEKSNYQTIKWVRYVCQNGSYACRI